MRLGLYSAWGSTSRGIAYSCENDYGSFVKFTRITVRPEQLGGVPCIRGRRIPVATVVGMVADEMTDNEILQAYPDLEAEDIREALRFAAESLRERELPLLVPS